MYDNSDSNQYYDGPCGTTDTDYDYPCNSVPICDENICTTSCIKFMHYKRGMCIENECYCQKETEPTKPIVEEDWNHDDQNGKIILLLVPREKITEKMTGLLLFDFFSLIAILIFPFSRQKPFEGKLKLDNRIA